MKRIFKQILLLFMVGGLTFSFVACGDDDEHVTKNVELNQKVASPTVDGLLGWLSSLGVKLEAGKTYEIVYRSGCFTREYKSILWGAYKYEKVSCGPGCDFCELKSVREIKGSVTLKSKDINREYNSNIFTIDSNNVVGLNVDYDSKSDEYRGIVVRFDEGVISDKTIVCFMVDISKVNGKKNLYDTDALVLMKELALNGELAYNLGILPENQFIPAGNYPVLSCGNVRLWWIELPKTIKY